MIYTSIHNVMSIEFTKTRTDTTETGHSYCARKIIIKDADGKAYELILFADDSKYLEAK